MPGIVLGPAAGSTGAVLVLLAEEGDAVCAARPPADAGRAVVVRWHPAHPGDAILEEDAGDPWLLAGTTAAATVLSAAPLGLGAFRHEVEVRPAGGDAVIRRADLAGELRPGTDLEVLWSGERDDVLAGEAVRRVAAARQEALAADGVRAPGRVVSVRDTRRRGGDGAVELVVVVEVFPPDGSESFYIARRGAFRGARSPGDPASVVYLPHARHLHVVTF